MPKLLKSGRILTVWWLRSKLQCLHGSLHQGGSHCSQDKVELVFPGYTGINGQHWQCTHLSMQGKMLQLRWHYKRNCWYIWRDCLPRVSIHTKINIILLIVADMQFAKMLWVICITNSHLRPYFISLNPLQFSEWFFMDKCKETIRSANNEFPKVPLILCDQNAGKQAFWKVQALSPIFSSPWW